MVKAPGELERRYLSEAVNQLVPRSGLSGQVTWECPSNIALIKYWGKRQGQLPANPSLSFNLTHCVTRMAVEYELSPDQDFSLDFLFHQHPDPVFTERLTRYLQQVSQYLPFLRNMRLIVRSWNTFPHAAGIASSASSFAALALVLCSIEQAVATNLPHTDDFYRKASFLARLGSGSAARSVYGGTALWGHTAEFEGSSDEAALSVSDFVHAVFRDYRDSILVVHAGQKEVSSSAGHLLMDKHPFARARALQAGYNLSLLLKVLHRGDQDEFTQIIEQEALTLHALMLSSSPGIVLIRPNTLEIISKVRIFRKETGIPVGFTLDAGANVHVLYAAASQAIVQEFIHDHLRQYCENGQVIHDQVGGAPVKIS